MTTPNLPDIGTVPTLRRLPRAFSNVQPFTYEDGLTHYQILERLRAFVQYTLVPALNKALEEFGDEIEDLVEGTLNDILARLDEQTEYVDGEIASLVEYVNAAVQSIINNSIELQDAVLVGILSDEESASGSYLSDRLSVYGVGTVHIISVDGQSNGVGRGVLTGVEETPHPRIFQYARSGSSNGTIVPGVDPFAHPQGNAGVGPVSTVVREWINDLPSNDVILVVPNAVGGTYLADITSNGWNPNVDSNLLSRAIKATTDAAAAAGVMFPGYRVSIDAVLWVSGETDAAQVGSRATYSSLMRALIAKYVAAYGDGVKVVMQELSPEQRNIKPGALNIVDSVYREIARTDDRADIGLVPRNKVGYMNADRLHIDTRGQRELYGPADYEALRRVLGGRASTAYASDPVAPFAPGGLPVINESFSGRENEPVIAHVNSEYGNLPITTWGGAGGAPVIGTQEGSLRFMSGLGSSNVGYWAITSPVGGEMRYRVRLTTGESYRLILGADAAGSLANALVIAPGAGKMRAVQYDSEGSNTGEVWNTDAGDGEYNIVWAYTNYQTIRVWVDLAFAFEVPRWDSGSHVIGGGSASGGVDTDQAHFRDILANVTDTMEYVGQ